MPKKKQEDTVEETPTETTETPVTDETAVKAQADNANAEQANEDNSSAAEDKKAADATEENSDAAGAPSLLGSVVGAVASAVGSVAGAVVDGATGLVNAITGDDNAADDSKAVKTSKRAEKIGTVQSDKMMKTVTVRVDRVLKHPMYRKYIKRRKNFMAHDELGAKTGDKVRIIETRPLSAKKRWRVVEIIQKAER